MSGDEKPDEKPSEDGETPAPPAGAPRDDAAPPSSPDAANAAGEDGNKGTDAKDQAAKEPTAQEDPFAYDDTTSKIRLDLPAGAMFRDVATAIYHNYYGARQEARPPGRVGVADLTHARAVHVRTPSDRTLHGEAAGHQVVFCRGAPDTGRSHSATVVLDELTGRSRTTSKVIVLDAARGLDAALGQLEKGCGHLLDGSGASWADAISRGLLNQARAALGDSGYLIILVDADSVQSHHVPVVDHAPPEPRQVAVFNLGALLAGEGVLDARTLDQARSHAGRLIDEACQAHAAAREWLEDITSSTTTGPAEAALFAEAIYDWQRRKQDDADAEPSVAQFRNRRHYEQAAGLLRRYDGTDSPLRQSYAISAAVLDGLALNEIIDGAVKLGALLDEVEHPGEPGQREVFAQPLARWLRHVEMAAADPEAGDRGGTTVRMPSRELARLVIELAWRQYDAARPPILAWLKYLCEWHRDHRVRIRAVQALAFIAAHDYAHIKERVLDVWSARERPVEHLAASWLMEAMVLDGTSTDKVLEVLRRWSRSPERSKRAVAVRAYGTSIASENSEDAIAGIRISAVLPDLGWLPEVSLLEMYLLGLTEEVTAELTLWMRGVPAMRERAGRVLVRISQVRRGEEDESPQPYHLLWALACEPDRIGASLRQIAELWDLACAHESSRSAAWQMIGRWAQDCREHPELRGTFTELIDEFQKAASDDETRERLDVYRRWWNRYLDEEAPK